MGWDYVAGFVNKAGVAEGEEVLCVLEGDFLFPFAAGHAVMGGAFDGEDAFVVTDADADGVSAVMGNVALLYAEGFDCGLLERVVQDQEFPFCFYMHSYISHLDMSLPEARPLRISVEEIVTRGALRSLIL